MNKKQIKKLFEFAIQDPKKWDYDSETKNVNYTFSNYGFSYNNYSKLSFFENGKSEDIYFKHPIISHIFIPKYWKASDGDPFPIIMGLLLIIVTFWIFALITAFAVYVINMFGVPTPNSIIFYNCFSFPITYIITSFILYFKNRKIYKKLKILDLMKDNEKKSEYEEKIEKETKKFNDIVKEHFKKQSRREKLKQIIEKSQ